ncbi:MAG: SulP family inorganic anion transporter [Akkermansiaceae bacterium]|nr:SulP family inorganic anion transporter [Akkermansiaceae bacterium]NNM28127.1 SulP family inorganic anion transporter [Akkermansiaceae bacterium]
MPHPLSRSVRLFAREVRALLVENTLDPLPIRGPLRRYNGEKFRHDIRAAFNVALLALPQGMAYAAIAELPIIYGIACSAIAAIVAPFFSGSRHTILGPTNATSFMIFSFFAAGSIGAQKIAYMPMLCLMVGVFCILGALLKVADLLQYVSRSVLIGYISGAAVLIIANQLKHILGIAPQVSAEGGQTFIGIVQGLGKHLPAMQWQPLALAAATLGVYVFLQRRFRILPTFAITLVLFSALATGLRAWLPGFDAIDTFAPFTISDLRPRLPDFSVTAFFDQVSLLAAVAFAVAFLASLENTVMAKSLASHTGDRPDVNQDMFAVGVSNLAAAVFAGMPASGSLTRSQLNYDSGARTRFASLFCGIICVGGIFLLAVVPLVSHIPKACLAALVVGIAVSLISLRLVRICLRSTGDDAAVLITTFVAALVSPLHVAIFIGVALSITLFLRKASRPFLVEYEINDEGDLRELGEKRKRPNPAISIVHVEGDLFFGAAELFRTQIQRTVIDENLRVIILRLKNARHLDATSVMALEDLIRFARSHERHIIVSGATREVYRVLKSSGVLDVLQEGADRSAGESNIFLYRASNPNISTRDALKRAQQFLGTTKADIKIFYDPSKEK